MKTKSNENLSGNEVHYTNNVILLEKNMLCSKRYYQQGFNIIAFSHAKGGTSAGSSSHSRRVDSIDCVLPRCVALGQSQDVCRRNPGYLSEGERCVFSS